MMVLLLVSVSLEEFTPEVNWFTNDEWNTVSLTNLINYPLGWITTGID